MLYLRGMSENKAEKILCQREEWLRLAVQAGKMYAYEWDVTTDVLVRSPEYVNVLAATEPRIDRSFSQPLLDTHRKTRRLR